MARVFVSHATRDRRVADEVSEWLRDAGHEAFVDHDLHDGISVGDRWRERLYRELRAVDAVIGVVTSSFVASSWCAAELGVADALGCRLVPLRAEPDVVHPLLTDLQYADYVSDVGDARARILKVCHELEFDGRSWKQGENPYPGLEPFDATRSRVFFGRTSETREVVKRLRLERPGVALAVVGPSGCGKSSLLTAGLLPALEADGAWHTVDPVTPRADPVAELARSVASAAARLGLGWSAGHVRSRLDADADGLLRVADDLIAARPGARRRLLVPVDQAEELFTRSAPRDRQRFAELLGRALTGPVQVVAVLRSEFLDDLVDLPGLPAGRIDAYVLSPLDHERLRDVIEQPARTARLRFDPELVSRLVTDTGGGEALPLLAFTLHRLAEGLGPGDTVSLARYEDLGGVVDALTRHADDALTEAVRLARPLDGSTGDGLDDHDILLGLTRLVAIDDAGRWARRSVESAGLDEGLREAFRLFVDRRLLLTGTDDAGRAWVTVVHEALFTAWRPLAAAIADVATALRTAQAVGRATAEWIRAGRPDHHLWDRERLAAARSALGVGPGETGRFARVALDRESTAFLTASADRVRMIKERERRRRTRTVAALSVLLVIALIGGAVAVLQRQRARAGQDLAIARSMMAQADRIRDIDPRAAMQFGVAALSFDGGPQTQASLQQTLTTTRRFTSLRGHERAVYGLAISGDGRLLATAGGDASIRLWEISDARAPRQLGVPLVDGKEAVNDVAFAPDGATLAAAHGDSMVRLWDVRDPEHARLIGSPLQGHEDWVFGVTFSPDGHTLITSGKDGTAILWDVTDREHPRRLGEPLGERAGPVRAVLSPTGNVLAIAGGSGTVTLWDVADREHPHQLGGPLEGGADRAVFSPDGGTLATANNDGTLTLWDVRDPTTAAVVGSGAADGVQAVAFSADGRTLASTHADGGVRLWDVTDRSAPVQIGQALVGHTGAALDVAFTPDGRALATSSLDQTAIVWDLTDHSVAGQVGRPLAAGSGAVWGSAVVPGRDVLVAAGEDRMLRLWDVTDRAEPLPLAQPIDTGQIGGVVDTSLSADGRLLAAAGADRSVTLWDLSDPHAVRALGPPLAGPDDDLWSVAVRPDGRLAAVSGHANQRVALWDLSDPQRPRRIDELLATGHIQTIYDLAFSPDGETLATASQDQTIRLWDVRDPRAPVQLGQHLRGHTDAVLAVAFSPDGRTLASAGNDQTIRLWDVTNRDRPQPRGATLNGHSGGINALAFSPDGRILASASSDHTIRLWDVRDGRVVTQLGRPLTGHTGTVNTVAFGPDGRTLVSGDSAATVILWDVPMLGDDPVDRIAEACRRAGDPLDAAAWNQYAPGVEYRETCS